MGKSNHRKPPRNPGHDAQATAVSPLIEPKTPDAIPSQTSAPSDTADRVKFLVVLAEERREIAERRERPFSDKEKTQQNWTGLCLSGGGIRAACFSLGILEGLDRLSYPPSDEEGEAKAGGPSKHNHLEFFDYVSSVSGGSCAAGHLATTMLPRGDESPKPVEPQWLGNVPLASKTVPGWLWGLGVWFLGAVFQLLKTGALLVGVLALVAFGMRVLDAPDAAFFCSAMGSDSDVQRGFVPFWITLWVFLVGYGFYVWKKDEYAVVWFRCAAELLAGYILIVMLTHDDNPLNRWRLPFWFHYGALLLLVLPGLCIPAGVLAWGWIVRSSPRFAGRVAPDRDRREARVERTPLRLRTALLAPLLVGLFCFAGLVTTGDIEFSTAGDDLSQLLATQEKSQWYGDLGNRIYFAAWVALGLASLGFVFPKNLFQSARRIEEHNSAGRAQDGSWFKTRGWEPVFRVVVFLCSYGVVLLVVFLIFSTVAKENVSGYYDWRKELPSAAFHFTDFRDPEMAWAQIAYDESTPKIEPPPEGKLDSENHWHALASRLMQAKADANVNLDQERRDLADLQLLSSLPWSDRLFWWLARLWPRNPWKDDGYDVEPSAKRHYELMASQNKDQRTIALRIADSVLSDPRLYTLFPDDAVSPEAYVQKKLKAKWDPVRYEGLGKRYRVRAKALEATRAANPDLARSAAFKSAVRNNNRYAMSLYLPVIVRDRRDHVVFSSIVWTEDQWTRLRIAAVAWLVWFLCCTVDVNTFSLHAFYRGHVISGWVKIPPGKAPRRWLHETERTYRGHEFGPNGGANPPDRRAPLPLFNATLEGNRWLGQEPELPLSIFSFSPLASGSGETHYWRSHEQVDPDHPEQKIWKQEFARRNHLDVGQMVAISGAFLSPGTVANPALSAVLHLLNIQTGSWVHDPAGYERRTPMESLRFHFCQSLGIDREQDSRYMLTDGAHVENLGLYALLQRRCTLIVAADCSQEDRSESDPGRRFDALIQVLQQASVDGVEIGPFLSSRAFWLKPGEVPRDQEDRPSCRHKRSTGLDLVLPADPKKKAENSDKAAALQEPQQPDKPENPPPPIDPNLSPAGRDAVAAGLKLAQEHFVFARIAYPEGGRGLLVYLRPTLTGDEGDGLLHGAAGSFPDDDPMDQFYSPSKMNTYRLLGRHIAVELMHDPVMKRTLRRIVAGRQVGLPPQDAEPTCDEYCGAPGPPSPCLGRTPRPFRSGDRAPDPR